MYLGDYSVAPRNGRHRLLEIEKVKNGYLVTYCPLPEKFDPVKFQENQKERLEKQKLSDKERLSRTLKEQAAAMKVAGEAMIKSKEDWDDSNDDLDFSKIDQLVDQISSDTGMSDYPMAVNPYINYIPPEPECLIFPTKDELLKFLVESL